MCRAWWCDAAGELTHICENPYIISNITDKTRGHHRSHHHSTRKVSFLHHSKEEEEEEILKKVKTFRVTKNGTLVVVSGENKIRHGLRP